MASGLVTSPDITALSLQESSALISGATAFTIGQASVSPEKLLASEGITYRGLALQEARALGSLVININRQWWRLSSSNVTRVRPESHCTTLGDIMLTTTPMLGAVQAPDGAMLEPHSWRFATHFNLSGLPGRRRTELVGVSLRGRRQARTTEQEGYELFVKDLKDGPVKRGALPLLGLNDPEDPDHPLYLAELGLLRAARIELGDKSANPVVE